ncbi:unnamed protein product [Prunus brigantina]
MKTDEACWCEGAKVTCILKDIRNEGFNLLQECFQNLERIQANFTGRRSHRKAERSDDFDCTLCLI